MLKEGNKTAITKSTITTAGLMTISLLLVGCSSGTPDTSKKISATPSSPETSVPIDTQTPTETPEESQSPDPSSNKGLDYSQEIELANNDLELEFLTIALNSCERAQKDRIIFTVGKNKTYFRPADVGDFPYWPFDQVSVKDGKVGSGEFINSLPLFFQPCDLEIQARIAGRDSELVEHKLERLSDTSYVWSQHNGGANLDKSYFQVSDGFLSSWGRTKKPEGTVEYGPLTAEQLALFDAITG